METKTYPKQGLYEVELSTVLPCGVCGVPNQINEKMLVDDEAGKVYHTACGFPAQTMENESPTKVYEMTVEEGLPVKSDGS